MTEEKPASAIVEEYLEAILNMTSERKKVHGARLAERLLVSRPTVTATLQRMKRDGLIAANRQKEISLTPKGVRLGVSIVRRHRLAERLLTDILKIPWSEAHQEACLLEHSISEKVMERLYETLGRPEYCPHGNPIPVDDVMPSLRGVPLDTVAPGQTVIVERISEEATRLQEIMTYFEAAGIRPGARLKIGEVTDFAGTIKVKVGRTPISLGIKAAALVWVIPE